MKCTNEWETWREICAKQSDAIEWRRKFEMCEEIPVKRQGMVTHPMLSVPRL
jgi:hypothetical protein